MTHDRWMECCVTCQTYRIDALEWKIKHTKGMINDNKHSRSHSLRLKTPEVYIFQTADCDAHFGT